MTIGSIYSSPKQKNGGRAPGQWNGPPIGGAAVENNQNSLSYTKLTSASIGTRDEVPVDKPTLNQTWVIATSVLNSPV